MKRFTALLLACCMMFGLYVPAQAAGSGMDNFQKAETYNGQFADIDAGYWAASSVKLCYEYGLMKGASAAAFNPKGDLTVAEAIVMADRIHEIYHTGKSTLNNGDPWYQPYVDYAMKNGLIAQGDFSSYTAKATRAQMAYLFCHALPQGTLVEINSISSIPDVSASHPYAKEIQALYKAGVLTGSDMYGTFNPDSNIIRAEAAAILSRVALPNQRKDVVLMKTFTRGNVTLAMPQSAEVNGAGDMYDVYAVASDKEKVMGLISGYSDPSFQGVDISALPQSTINSLIVNAFANTQTPVSGIQSAAVKFGALNAYRSTGTMTVSGVGMDCIIYTYISGNTLNMICLLANNNDAVLTNMANGIRIGGSAPSPLL